MNRRAVLASLGYWALTPSAALAGPPAIVESSLRVRELDVGGPGAPVRRARLFVPAAAAEQRRVLVLLHGRGEVGNVTLGLRAWSELYGLLETDSRLRAGRVAPSLTSGEIAYTPPERISELERELASAPYPGMAFVCPVTPNPAAQGNREAAHERFAAWLAEDLLTAVRTELPEARKFGVVGCSMGGPIALEAFVRRPAAFASLGMVQGAFGAWRAPGYATRLAELFQRTGPRPIHLLTSTRDPYREGNEALGKELLARSVQATVEVPRGPHNQPFLRQIGTLLALRWQARMLTV